MPIYFIISAIKLVSNINVLKFDMEMTPNMAWEEVNVIEKHATVYIYSAASFSMNLTFLPSHLFYNTLIK